MEKIPVVVIEFHGESNLVFHKEQWEEIGKYQGFLKEFKMSISQIKKVTYKLINWDKFPTAEWPC